MVLFLINLGGAVALLIWAVRQIRVGVQRAFAAELRAGLRRAGRSLPTAALGGALAALALQSSTAVAMLAAAFAAAGTLAAAPGLALMLGADLGSAVVAQVLLAPIQGLVPLLLLIGTPLFFSARGPRGKQAGRILIGLALVLVALTMIRAATEPLRDSPVTTIVLRYLAGDPVSAFVIGAVMAWAMHSSVAAVLMVVTLAAGAMLAGPAAAALVLGCNLGGALIPVWLTWQAEPEARRLALANLIARGGCAGIALVVLVAAHPVLELLGDGPARQAINLHLVFNLAVLLLALPLVPALVRMAAGLLPAVAPRRDEASALDPLAADQPARALACTAREILRMGEAVNAMLVPALSMLRNPAPETLRRIAEDEDRVDRMHFGIKLYVARLQETALDPDQARRAVTYAIIAGHLEEAGDLISTSLVEVARRLQDGGVAFSAEGWRDLADFHDRVLSNAQLALNVLVTGDVEAARQLVSEKDAARKIEQDMQARHLDRLRAANPSSIETSNLHQETMRALKSINSAFCWIAYPIMEDAGDLLQTRLAVPPSGQA